MKLKGEKELLAEEMYSNIESEYTALVMLLAAYIENIYNNDKLLLSEKLEEIAITSKRIATLNDIVTTIFKMDLSINQIKAFNELSINSKLLINIEYIISNTNNKCELSEEINKITSLYVILNQDREIGDTEENGSSTL
ncbi:MAG: hypothetical protein J6A59_14995 [Lachnospiraceae bacterium]|nr:hypothetical protein [Lachnospiraceae bacterium]